MTVANLTDNLHVFRRHVLAMALMTFAVTSCSGSVPTMPSFELPSFDAAAVEQLVEDTIAEVERLAASPPAIDVPEEIRSFLDGSGITVPPVPSNAEEICRALGTPGLRTVTGAGLGALLESLAVGGEVGLGAGLLVAVVFSTCPVWGPHLETALEGLP